MLVIILWPLIYRRDIFSLLNSSISEVWLTGHSLGGSILTLASADIKFNFPFIDVINYSYASPKVGDMDFVNGYEKLNIITNRIQNYWDIIPRLPFEILDYYHVKTLILLEQNNINNSISCIYNSLFPNDNIYINPFNWLYQHEILTYIELIRKCKN